MLEAVGLGAHMDKRAHQMSGGQRQRVAIARALVGDPAIVLADEPTASLDKASGREVVDRMQSLAREQGATILIVTHDNPSSTWPTASCTWRTDASRRLPKRSSPTRST